MTDDCRRAAERSTAFVDLLLPQAERTEMEAHLSACQRCRALVDAEGVARTVLRARSGALRAEPVPSELRARCEALARAESGSRADVAHGAARGTWFAWRRLVPVSVSALLVLVAVLALFSMATQRSNTLLAAQLTADHAKCFRLFAEEGATGADAARLERMLRDRYGWTVRVPPASAADGVELIGARRCLYADGSVPHVMYRVNGRDMSLFMLAGDTRDAADVTALGHRSRIWSRDDTTYVLVWPAAGGDLTAAVRYVMREAR